MWYSVLVTEVLVTHLKPSPLSPVLVYLTHRHEIDIDFVI